MSPRLRLAVALVGLTFFITHVRALPRTLEDLDSINFALGVEQFDVSRHRPHPPGYPVYIALGKISTAAVRAIEPSWDRDHVAAAGLAVWGLISGTLAILVFTQFWMAVGLTSLLAFLAALLAVLSPLFWFSAARPLSDTPGLVAAVVVQTLFVRGLRLARIGPGAPVPREWTVAAVAAGFIIGLRSQTLWLTGPLLFWCAGELTASRRPLDAVKLIGAAAFGALLWVVPLLWLNGGLARYLALVNSQGTADFQGVEMLATSPTWRLVRAILVRTFVWPWAGSSQLSRTAAWLANMLVALTVLGAIRLLMRGRRVLAAVLLSFWPYLVFHATFQDTLTLRYALPIVVPMAGLAVAAVSVLRTRLATVVVAVLAAVSLITAQPCLEAYSTEGFPVFRGFQGMLAALPKETEPPVLRMHHQVWWGVQRVMEWYQPYWDVGPQPHPGSREWLAIVQHWMSGSTRPVWFLTDVSRTDIALFDRRARTLMGRFELRPDVRALMPGSRPTQLDWWRVSRPNWMLATGWALTPEIAGMTAADAAAPTQRAAEAFLRRQVAPLRLMLGGRYLAGAGQPAALLSVSLDDRPLAQWRITGDPIWFVHWIDLANGTGAGPGPYARLAVRAASDDPARPAPAIDLEQFDAARLDDVVLAFTEGWHEPEGDPQTGRLWRWTSSRATLDIRGASGDLTLRLSGESPRKYFDHAPNVVIRAGDRELGRFAPSADFSQDVDLPISALDAALGLVSIETDLTFVPAERGPSPDRRKLGLKLWQAEVRRKR